MEAVSFGSCTHVVRTFESPILSGIDGTTGTADTGVVDLRIEVTVFDRFLPYTGGCCDSEREVVIVHTEDERKRDH